MSDEFLLSQKHRPQKVSECILPDRLKKIFQNFVESKDIPNMMLAGSPGVGKTTVALAMCEELGINYLFINSSEERGIDTLRVKIMGYASTVSLEGGRKVIILDEADNITPDAQLGLRGAMEAFSSNCTFILTCNYKARLIDGIHSRCTVIDFALSSEERPKMALAFYKRVSDILSQENIVYDKSVLAKLIEKYFPDFRRTLNEIQRFSSGGTLDSSILSQINDLKNIDELVKSLREKDFKAMRKWVTTNSDIDPSRIFRRIYDGIYDILKPENIPQAVVILGKYQYQSAFVADQEINLVACLTEMMIDCME